MKELLVLGFIKTIMFDHLTHVVPFHDNYSISYFRNILLLPSYVRFRARQCIFAGSIIKDIRTVIVKSLVL